MNPYLEDPALWSGVHTGIIYCINTALNADLPPGFVAAIGERVYIEQTERSIYSDVALLEQPSPVIVTAGAASAVADPAYVVEIEPAVYRERFVEVRSVRDNREVIAVIEVLSPGNKAAGSEGRRQYQRKQNELIASRAHLLEIDLLRGGAFTLLPPPPERKPVMYLISLHRGGTGGRFEVWTAALHERLPRVWVPLAESMPDVTLDIQAALDRCYTDGAFGSQINHDAAMPSPPLSPEDARWADALLKEKGLRTA